MSNLVNGVDAEKEYPCIEFSTPTRTFERLFKDTSLTSLRGAVTKKLGLGPSSKLEFIQQRDNGKAYDLEDDDDFDAFKAYAFKTGFVNVKVNVTEVPQNATLPTPAPIANIDPTPLATSQVVHSAQVAALSVPANASSATPAMQDGASVPTPIKRSTKAKKPAVATSLEPAIQENSADGKAADAFKSSSTPADKIAALSTDQENDAANHAKPKRVPKKAAEPPVATPAVPPPVESTPQILAATVVALASDTDAPAAPTVKKAKKPTKLKAPDAVLTVVEEAGTAVATGPRLPPTQSENMQLGLAAAKKTKHASPNTVRFSEPVLPSVPQGRIATAPTNTQPASADPPQTAPEEPVKRKRGRPKKILDAPVVVKEPTLSTDVEEQAIPAPTVPEKVAARPEPKKRGPKPKEKDETSTAEPPTVQSDAPKDTTSMPETGESSSGEKSVPKKRVLQKKDAITAADTTSDQADILDTAPAVDSKSPHVIEDKPAPKKRGPKPKKKIGDVEIENGLTEPGTIDELSLKDAKIKKRKKSERLLVEETEDNAPKKRKLTPEDPSFAQEADSNEPLLDRSSPEDVNPTASARIKKYQSKAKRELTEVERQQLDAALDAFMGRLRGRIRIEALEKADEVVVTRSQTLTPSVKLTEDGMEVDDDEDDEMDEPGPDENITAKQEVSGKAAPGSTQAPPTPPRRSFMSSKKDTIKLKKQRSPPVVHKDEEMDEDFLQSLPSLPLTQQRSTTSNSASTTEVEKSEFEREEEEEAGDEEDELRSDAAHAHLTGPDIATMSLDRSDSERSESESEQELAMKMPPRRILATSTPRPSMNSIPSLRNIAETSSKEIFSSPRDTPSRYQLYSASQPIKGSKSEIIAETDPSSSSDESDSSSDKEESSHIPKEKRAGATTDPRKSKGLKGAFMQYFGSQP